MILPSSAFSSGVSWVAIPEDILKQSCLLEGGWVINLIQNVMSNECYILFLVTCQDWRPWRPDHPRRWGRQWGAHWRSHPQSPEGLECLEFWQMIRSEFYLRWLKLKANVIELPLGVSHPQHQIDRPLVFRNVLLISKNLNNVHHTTNCFEERTFK